MKTAKLCVPVVSGFFLVACAAQTDAGDRSGSKSTEGSYELTNEAEVVIGPADFGVTEGAKDVDDSCFAREALNVRSALELKIASAILETTAAMCELEDESGVCVDAEGPCLGELLPPIEGTEWAVDLSVSGTTGTLDGAGDNLSFALTVSWNPGGLSGRDEVRQCNQASAVYGNQADVYAMAHDRLPGLLRGIAEELKLDVSPVDEVDSVDAHIAAIAQHYCGLDTAPPSF